MIGRVGVDLDREEAEVDLGTSDDEDDGDDSGDSVCGEDVREKSRVQNPDWLLALAWLREGDDRVDVGELEANE